MVTVDEGVHDPQWFHQPPARCHSNTPSTARTPYGNC
jgi:hypothetical protein